MGSLSNLYISQSYTSLLHLGNDGPITNLAPGQYTQFQDGLGNSLGISVNASGDISSSGNIYATNIFPTITTSSFNQYTASTNSRLNNIESTTASLNSSVSQLNVSSASQQVSINALNQFTASQSTASINTSITNLNQFSASALISINNINSTTASLLVETQNLELFSASALTSISNLNQSSASQQVSINALNVFTASQSTASIVNSITNLNTFTSSANIRLNNLETTSASVNISISNLNSTTASQATSITNLNSFSQSAQISINSLNGATSSYANSASVALVDANQQSQINSLIAATGSYLTASADITALNAFTASQLNINTGYNTFTSSANQRLSSLETTSASVNISVSALNIFTASQSTASIVTSITNLNQFTQSAGISINALNSATSSYITESETASFARTNIDNNFTANQTFTNITAVSASFTYVQTLYETASVIYSSGSNQLGDELTDVQTLSGSVKVQGSLTVNGTSVLTSSVDISGLVTTASFNAYTQSNNQRVSSLETNSASVNISVSALNTFTASQSTASLVTSITNLNSFTSSANGRLNNIETTTASLLIETQNLELFSASQLTINAGYNTYTSSTNSRLNNIETTTASLLIETQNLELFSASALTSLSNLNTATASLFTSASLSLTTASFSGNTLTFRKGDGTTFGIVIPDVSGSTIDTGSFAITGSNTFTGTQTIRPTAGNAIVASGSIIVADGSTINTPRISVGTEIEMSGSSSYFRFLSGSSYYNMQLNPTTGAWAFSRSGVSNIKTLQLAGYDGANTLFENNPVVFDATTTGVTFNAPIVINSGINSNVQITGSLTANGLTLTETGIVNQITLDDHSGSLVLFAKGYTSSSLAHISGSNASISASVGNLIFKTNNNTQDTILTGSNNIFVNPAAATAGFKRYIGGNSNIFLGLNSIPSITGSMGFSPSMILNSGGGAYTFRGPVSSSAWSLSSNLNLGTVNIGQSAGVNAEKLTSGLTFTTNNIQGTLNINASSAFLTGSTTTLTSNTIAGTTTLSLNSSAASLVNNIINDSGFTLTNNYFSSSVGLGTVTLSRNNIAGQNNTFNITGSQPAGTTNATSYSDNFIGGASNTLHADVSNARVVGANAYHSATRNIIFGNNLIVSASSLLTDTSTLGSAFFGRFNSVTGNADLTAETVFAVGTGTSTSARKTGFLIDSGSNTFVEGSLNVSGATSLNGNLIITGSLTASLQQGFVYVGNASGITTTVATSSFGGALPAGLLSSSVTNFVDYSASVDSRINSIVTGTGFATTGSNSFNGNQIITGSMTSSLDIVVSGINIGLGNPAGTSTIAIGANALINNISSNNLAIGAAAMRFTSASAATSNVAIGASALSKNQTDSQIAIGANALENVTTGNANTAIGRLSMQNTTTGFDNLALGTNSLLSNTTGQRNIAIGKESLRNAAVNASRNVAIGYSTLYNAKSNNNVAIGASAFEQLQSGSQNVAIGWTTGYDVTSGNYNTLIGGNLRGQSGWDSVVAISDGNANIKFFNSGSRTTITNDTLISGSLTTTGSMTIQSGSAFFANGNRQFNVGAFQSDVTQSGSANVSQSMNFETTDISEGVSIASNSRITLANAGTYNIQFSVQVDRVSGSGTDTVHIWLKKNGTNVDKSAGAITISGGAAEAKTVAAWNYVVNAAANDYYELCWQSTDTNIQLINVAATGNIPATPSIILTVTQVR